MSKAEVHSYPLKPSDRIWVGNPVRPGVSGYRLCEEVITPKRRQVILHRTDETEAYDLTHEEIYLEHRAAPTGWFTDIAVSSDSGTVSWERWSRQETITEASPDRYHPNFYQAVSSQTGKTINSDRFSCLRTSLWLAQGLRKLCFLYKGRKESISLENFRCIIKDPQRKNITLGQPDEESWPSFKRLSLSEISGLRLI